MLDGGKTFDGQKLALFVMALSLIPPAAAQISPAEQKPSCTIEGAIVAQASGQPLSKAWVFIHGLEKYQQSYSKAADSNGHFSVVIVPGRYRVTASRHGYAQQEYGSRLPGHAGTPLSLAPGQ